MSTIPHADIRYDEKKIVILQRDWMYAVERGGFLLYVLDKRANLPAVERFDAFDACKRRFDDLTIGMTTVAVQ